MSEESADPQDDYFRALTALARHLSQFHEIDSFQFVTGLHQTAFLNQRDAGYLNQILLRMIKRAGP